MTAVLATRVGDYVVRAYSATYAHVSKAADKFNGSQIVAIVDTNRDFVSRNLRPWDSTSTRVYGAAFAPGESALDVAMSVAGIMCRDDEIDRAMRDDVSIRSTRMIGIVRATRTLAGVTWHSVYPARYEYAGHPIV